MLDLVQDGAEYFDPPGGLITLDLNLAGLLEGAAPPDYQRTDAAPKEVQPFAAHFALMNAQLQQVSHVLNHKAVLQVTFITIQIFIKDAAPLYLQLAILCTSLILSDVW